jgi:hypothetical protein
MVITILQHCGLLSVIFIGPVLVSLGGPVASVLAIGPKVRGFKPGRERWIFNGDKNP